MSLVIFCLPFSFVDYVSVKGEISIMLNEISQAVGDKYHVISPLTGLYKCFKFFYLCLCIKSVTLESNNDMCMQNNTLHDKWVCF